MCGLADLPALGARLWLSVQLRHNLYGVDDARCHSERHKRQSRWYNNVSVESVRLPNGIFSWHLRGHFKKTVTCWRTRYCDWLVIYSLCHRTSVTRTTQDVDRDIKKT